MNNNINHKVYRIRQQDLNDAYIDITGVLVLVDSNDLHGTASEEWIDNSEDSSSNE